jgi:hypothetical protein
MGVLFDNQIDMVATLQSIVRNDKTDYRHHESRPWDGRKPGAEGGSIWLTPRELATRALRQMGASVPDRMEE